MPHLSATPDHTLPPTVVIRRAAEADRSGVARLAALDSAPAPGGNVLLALVDDVAWAALSLDDGRAVADPFRPSAHAVELLRIRAGQLRAAPAARSRALPRLLGLGRAAA
jgi:hypothetical protein